MSEHKHKCSEAPDSLLMKTFAETIDAGNKLAEAAHRVQSDYDGVHRLRLALSNWYTVRANEFGRKPLTPQKQVRQFLARQSEKEK